MDRRTKRRMSCREMKEYLSHHHITQLLESLLTGLLYHRPEDPLSFLERCLIRSALMGGPESVCWDTFIHLENKTTTPAQGEAGDLLTSTTLPKPPSHSPQPVQLPPILPQISPKTTQMPFTTPQILPGLPLTLPKTTQIPQVTAQIPTITTQISHPPLQSLSPTPSIPKQSPPKLPITTQIAPIVSLTPSMPFYISTLTSKIPPKTPLIPPITSKALFIVPEVSPGSPQQLPQTPSGAQPMKSTRSPPVSPSVSHETPSTDTQTTYHQRELLHPPAPGGGPIAPPAPTAVVKDQATPAPPATPALHSQLSIDSDSDMTESFGLRQEVNVLYPQRPRPLIIFIIGGPGSGKSSEAAKLEQNFGLRWVSLDQLLRKQILIKTSPSRRWELISQVLSHGELGPQEDTVCELKRQLVGDLETLSFVVEGFPQDVHQAVSFQEQVGIPDLVILLLCSSETLRCRLQRRAATLGLLGDSGPAHRRRLDTFRREIVSIRRFYRQQRVLRQVNADRSEDTVFADVASLVKEKLFMRSQL